MQKEQAIWLTTLRYLSYQYFHGIFDILSTDLDSKHC